MDRPPLRCPLSRRGPRHPASPTRRLFPVRATRPTYRYPVSSTQNLKTMRRMYLYYFPVELFEFTNRTPAKRRI
jgi:hypothetical protein